MKSTKEIVIVLGAFFIFILLITIVPLLILRSDQDNYVQRCHAAGGSVVGKTEQLCVDDHGNILPIEYHIEGDY